jgi:hypothetical protein
MIPEFAEEFLDAALSSEKNPTKFADDLFTATRFFHEISVENNFKLREHFLVNDPEGIYDEFKTALVAKFPGRKDLFKNYPIFRTLKLTAQDGRSGIVAALEILQKKYFLKLIYFGKTVDSTVVNHDDLENMIEEIKEYRAEQAAAL